MAGRSRAYSVKRTAVGYLSSRTVLNKELSERRPYRDGPARGGRAHEPSWHFQPISNPAAQCGDGFETLARWRHPVRGMSRRGLRPGGCRTRPPSCAMARGRWPRPAAAQRMAGSPQGRGQSLAGAVFRAQSGRAWPLILTETGLAPTRLGLESPSGSSLMTLSPRCLSLHQLNALCVGISLYYFGTVYPR